MNQLKPIFVISTLLIALSFTLPSLLVLPFSKEKSSVKLNDQGSASPPTLTIEHFDTEVAVFRSAKKNIETLPLEEYVVGVVASEMGADFELEALKAQALTARTYVVSHLLHPDTANLPEGANVTDTVTYQVYKDHTELKKIWGKDYDWKLKKITEAVQETKGEILTYNEKPITASFFSTSNGFTENAEEYWNNQVPYLKSVESPWDKDSPKFTAQKTLSINEFEEKLGVKINTQEDIGTIISRTSGKKVAEVKIDGKQFTGREIREKLDLRSTDFSWKRKGDSIIVTTKGFGHGVGMSQYGANGMAKEGKGYLDIVNHYYQNVAVSRVNQFFEQKVASK